MHRRRSVRAFALRVSCTIALVVPALAGCGDDDSGGGIDAGAGSGGTGTGSGGNGSGGMGTGGTGTGSGGVGTGGMGSGGMGSGGTGTGGASSDEDAGLDGGSSGGSDAGQAGMFRTVDLMMTGMSPHIGSMLEFRIVGADNKLVARGVLDPIQSASATFTFPDSTPPGSDFRLDFFADANDNRMYDAPPTDHQWREDVPASDPAMISFAHNTTFTDISMPALQDDLDFTLNASGMAPEMNKPLEMRVIDADTKQLVGRYVLGSISGATFSLKLAGIVKSGHSYQVDLFVDENGNGDYDAPPTDHAWRVMKDATSSGLTVAFAYSMTYQDVGF
jgi:hypothetical protein